MASETMYHKYLLKDLITVAPFQVRSRNLQSLGFPYLLFAFAAGEKISSEMAPREKYLQVLEGRLEVFLPQTKIILETGEILKIPADTSHHLHARTDTKFLELQLRKEEIK